MTTVTQCGLIAILCTGCGSASDLSEPAEREVQAASSFSSRDLFRGLFFGRGPVASLLPEIWDNGKPGSFPSEKPLDSSIAADRMNAETDRLVQQGLHQDIAARLHSAAKEVFNIPRTADKLSAAVERERQAISRPATDSQLDVIMNVITNDDQTFFIRFATEIQSNDPARVSKIIDEASAKIGNTYTRASSINKNADPNAYLLVDTGNALHVDETVEFWRDTFVAVHNVLIGNNFWVFDGQNFGNHSDLLRHDQFMSIIAGRLKA